MNIFHFGHKKVRTKIKPGHKGTPPQGAASEEEEIEESTNMRDRAQSIVKPSSTNTSAVTPDNLHTGNGEAKLITTLGDLPLESMGQDKQILDQQQSGNKKVNRALFTDDADDPEEFEWHRYFYKK